MNIKKKKTLALILSAMLLSTSLIGCNKDDGKKEEGKDGVVEIEMVHMLNPEIDVKNNAVLDKIEEELGIRLVIEAPPVNDFWTRTQVMVATGDMPDFFLNGTDVNFEKWSKEGLIADITDDIEKYPNLMKNITKEQWGDTTAMHDGKIYGVPRCNAYDYWGFMINKEWLNKVGMEAPKTVDEFIEVCRAFTNEDPDGNGKNDTYGASFGTDIEGGFWSLFNDFFSTAYNISQHTGMPDKNGEFNMKQYTPEYYDYLDAMKKLYEENIIDREFITHKSEEQVEKFAQGRVGIVGMSGKRYMTELEKYGLDPTKYEYCSPLVQKEGDDPKYVMPPSNWCAFLINSETDKKDDILRFLDWANTEEGFVLTHLGIQGQHYESYDIENRSVVQTEEQKLEQQKVAGDMFGFANAFDGRSLIEGGSTPESTKIWKENTEKANEGVKNIYTPFVKCFFSMANEIPDEMKNVSMLEVRYITGESSKEELKDYIDNEFKEKTEKYTKDYQEFMKENPVTIE